jgi:hypothetical protein
MKGTSYKIINLFYFNKPITFVLNTPSLIQQSKLSFCLRDPPKKDLKAFIQCNAWLDYVLNSDTLRFRKNEFVEGSKGIENPLRAFVMAFFGESLTSFTP